MSSIAARGAEEPTPVRSSPTLPEREGKEFQTSQMQPYSAFLSLLLTFPFREGR